MNHSIAVVPIFVNMNYYKTVYVCL